LDSVDFRVLEMVQRDSKPSTSEMASVLGLPGTTVYSKVHRLEREGVIQGYRALLDGRKLGRSVVARQLSHFSEVQEVHLVRGAWDFLIKLRSRDVESVGRFLAEKLGYAGLQDR
jgi:DNA-binding Lrp family transcriptional regulator